MRVLGVDFGFARIGLAVGESEHGITSMRPRLAASGKLADDAAKIAALAKREEAEIVVVGLPYEEDGTAGRMVRICLQLVDRLREQGCTVATVDESGSTHAAEANLRQQAELKASQRRKMRDAEAARIILERFFDEQAGL